ncbi:MAG: RagB/SusD family nutrient uptake outer membrane protein [Bacteroidales bacterium]|nr:RagB/SusD family nutrient uptake outer membrane protein [Bacteroidales bacterium]
MKMNKILYMIAAGTALVSLAGCDKFLDKMPDNRAEINTPEKIRALLVSAYPSNTYLTFNEYMSDNVDNIGDDNPGTNRFVDQCYAWEDVTEITNDCQKYFWNESYYCIAHANQALIAIRELSGIDGDQLDEKAIVAAGLEAEMAEALLCRAYNHFMLVNEFCLNYNEQTSATDLGVPYMEQAETQLNPKYERGNVAHVYELIDKDLQLALKYVNDGYFQVPKYHFNVKAAYAFATRFYLFYEKWDLAAEYATKCLGSQPKQVLRDWESRSKLEHDRSVLSNDFIKTSYNTNLLMLTAYTAFGYYFGYPGITKYSHNSYLSFTEVSYAANIWGPTTSTWRNLSSWYWDPPVWYNGSTYDQIAFWKIPYLFEYTDPVAQIGYAHAVYPAFTMDEVLLNRAEAYVMMREYDLAAADLTTWAHNIIKTQYFSADLTSERIVEFYKGVKYWTKDEPTIKKHLNPAFNIGEEGGIMESMLQCVLGFKRIENIAQGLRWFDIKRYGIEITRRTMEADPQAGQYDASLRIANGQVDILLKDDPRRAIQLPQEVISAGLTPNPR